MPYGRSASRSSMRRDSFMSAPSDFYGNRRPIYGADPDSSDFDSDVYVGRRAIARKGSMSVNSKRGSLVCDDQIAREASQLSISRRPSSISRRPSFYDDDSSDDSDDDDDLYAQGPFRSRSAPKEDPAEVHLCSLLKKLAFPDALRDLHEMLPYLQVAKTLTVADGMGRAFCRVHCNKPPKRKHIFNDPHFAQHWTHEGDNLWTFATESHSVKVHFTAEPFIPGRTLAIPTFY